MDSASCTQRPVRLALPPTAALEVGAFGDLLVVHRVVERRAGGRRGRCRPPEGPPHPRSVPGRSSTSVIARPSSHSDSSASAVTSALPPSGPAESETSGREQHDDRRGVERRVGQHPHPEAARPLGARPEDRDRRRTRPGIWRGWKWTRAKNSAEATRARPSFQRAWIARSSRPRKNSSSMIGAPTTTMSTRRTTSVSLPAVREGAGLAAHVVRADPRAPSRWPGPARPGTRRRSGRPAGRRRESAGRSRRGGFRSPIGG